MPFRRDVLLLLGFSLTFVQACAFKKDEPIKEKLVYAQKLDLNDPSLSKSFAEKVHSEIVKKVFVKGELTPEAEEMYLRSQPPEVTADWLSGIKSPGVRQIWKIKDTAAGLQANVLRPSLLVFEPENKPSLRLSFIKETGAYELTLPLLLWDGRSGLAHFSGNPVRDDGEQVFVRQDLDAHFKISGIPHRVFTGCVRELLIKDSSGSTLSSANLVGSEGCSGHGVLYPKFRFTSQTLELFRRKMLMGEELKLVSRSYVDSLVRRGTYEVAIDTQSLMRSVRSRLSAQGLELKDKEVSQEIKNILLEEFSAIKALQRSDYKIHIDLITESLTNRLAMSFCGNSCAKKIFDPSTKIEPQQIVSWSAGIIRPTDRLLEASHD
ncbi:MAG: hypothetical protein N2578_04005, partial [Bdellovibrionaceae bacterium]|nr:hypothetical protein [Pseudobdellovibrionaceae bacterium]